MMRYVWECKDCVKWRKSCNGVQCDPDHTWDGRLGGCSGFSDDPRLAYASRFDTQVPVREIGGQTSLEAWL